MKAAVCDDNKSMLEFISMQIAECAEAHGISCEISSFLSGTDFIAEQRKNAFDIVFLDIKMPDSDGFEVAKRIRDASDSTQIVFVTTEDSLVYESFDYQPFWFIPKTNPETLKTKLRSVVKKFADKTAQNRRIRMSLPRGEEKYIYSDSVLYVFSKSNYLNIVCASETINIREKINSFYETLPQQTFARIHNRYIVNMQRIAAVDFAQLKIIMQNETVLDISRAYKQPFLEQYNTFQRNFT